MSASGFICAIAEHEQNALFSDQTIESSTYPPMEQRCQANILVPDATTDVIEQVERNTSRSENAPPNARKKRKQISIDDNNRRRASKRGQEEFGTDRTRCEAEATKSSQAHGNLLTPLHV